MPLFLETGQGVYWAGLGTNAGSGGLVADLAVAEPFITRNKIRINSLSFTASAGGAGSAVRLGLYSDSHGQPGALIVDAGTVSTTASGNKTIVLGTAQILEPGIYWEVAVLQGGTTPTVDLYGAGSGGVLRNEIQGGASFYTRGSVSGALPDPFGQTGSTNGGIILKYNVSGYPIDCNVAIETDQAGSFTPILTPFVPGTVTQAQETDSAGTFTPRIQQRIALGTAIETDSARTISPGAKVRDLSTSGSSAHATGYTTGAFTPAADSLVLCLVQSTSGSASPTPATPIPTSGLSWTQIDTLLDSSSTHRTSLFYALAGSSPPTGDFISIGFGGQTQFYGFWSVIEITGVAQSGTIVQSATNTASTANGLTVTLSSFAKSDNLAIGAFGLPNYRTLTAGSGFTKVGNFGLSGTGTVLTEYKPNDTTVDMTSSAPATITGIAVEVKTA